MTRVALIAGRGDLPRHVAAACARPPLIAALDGFAPQDLAVDVTFRLERLVPFIRGLCDAGVTEVVFAGAIRRPRLDPALFDPATAAMVPRIMAAMSRGDDGALREAIAVMEEAGLQVRAVQDIAPELVPGPGLITGQPQPQDHIDADRATAIHAALGALDIGQGCVVAGGQCLAVETLPGTDAMLAAVAAMDPAIRPAARGVFFKGPKPGQDLRIDLPVLGPPTLRLAAAAGLSGIVLSANGVLCLDLPQMRRLADESGLFLWAR